MFCQTDAVICRAPYRSASLDPRGPTLICGSAARVLVRGILEGPRVRLHHLRPWREFPKGPNSNPGGFAALNTRWWLLLLFVPSSPIPPASAATSTRTSARPSTCPRLAALRHRPRCSPPYRRWPPLDLDRVTHLRHRRHTHRCFTTNSSPTGPPSPTSPRSTPAVPPPARGGDLEAIIFTTHHSRLYFNPDIDEAKNLITRAVADRHASGSWRTTRARRGA